MTKEQRIFTLSQWLLCTFISQKSVKIEGFPTKRFVANFFLKASYNVSRVSEGVYM